MLLVCPSCASSYEIDEGKLGSSGRSVRCKRCATIWFASAKPESAMTSVPQADDSVVAGLAEASGVSDIASPAENATAAIAAIGRPPREMGFETGIAFSDAVLPDPFAVAEEHGDVTAPEPDGPLFDDGVLYNDKPGNLEQIAAEAEPSIRPLAERKGKRAGSPAKIAGRSPVLSILFFAAALLVALALLAREPLMRLIPASAKVYAAMDLGRASPLSIKVVTSEIGQQGEAEFLTVEGEIENKGRDASVVPALTLAVRDRAGIDIYRWDIQSTKARLASGEKATFRARLAAPPPGSESVRVRFADGKSGGFEAKPDPGQPVSDLLIRGKNIRS